MAQLGYSTTSPQSTLGTPRGPRQQVASELEFMDVWEGEDGGQCGKDLGVVLGGGWEGGDQLGRDANDPGRLPLC